MKFIKTLTLLFVFSLFSCSEDLYETESNKSNYKVSYVNSVAIQNNQELVKTLRNEKIIKTNSLNKIVIDTVNNFSIDTDFVKFLQGPNFNSYTFKIIEQEENYLDNLVLVSQAGAPYSAFIMRYDLTEEEKTALNNGLTIDFTNKATVLKLSNSNITNDALGKLIYYEECNWVTTWQEVITITPCPIDGCLSPEWTGTSVSHVLVGSWVCTGGGGGSELGDVGTSPHGGGGGGSNTTVANPCNKIKKQNTKFPSLKQSLITLATTTSQYYENGTFIDNTATATTVNPVQTIPSNTANGGTIPLNMNPTNSYVMIAHTHDSYGTDGTGTYSVFSWDDLTTINNLIKNNHIDNSNFVFYVITADGTRYALTVDNATNLSDFFYDPSNLPFGTQIDTKKLFDMQKVFQKYYDKSKNGLITTTSTAMNDKTNFLKFIKEANLGITLFEVDATFTNYQKLSISNSGVVTPTPCN